MFMFQASVSTTEKKTMRAIFVQPMKAGNPSLASTYSHFRMYFDSSYYAFKFRPKNDTDPVLPDEIFIVKYLEDCNRWIFCHSGSSLSLAFAFASSYLSDLFFLLCSALPFQVILFIVAVAQPCMVLRRPQQRVPTTLNLTA
jgi:hypothetical protein